MGLQAKDNSGSNYLESRQSVNTLSLMMKVFADMITFLIRYGQARFSCEQVDLWMKITCNNLYELSLVIVINVC